MNNTYIPVKNQKFEIGRTINFAKCDCKECTYMNCPKNNYAVQMKIKPMTIQDFFNDNKEDILEENNPPIYLYSFVNKCTLLLTNELITELFDYLQFSFPKGTYWNPSCNIGAYNQRNNDDRIYDVIELVKFNRKHQEVIVGEININSSNISDYDLSSAQERLAKKISKAFRELKELIINYYKEQNKDWNVGWLSPTGRFYPCRTTEHSQLAQCLDSNEITLESSGWCKIIDDDLYMQSFDNRLTAEQRNWLSINGYEIDE